MSERSRARSNRRMTCHPCSLPLRAGSSWTSALTDGHCVDGVWTTAISFMAPPPSKPSSPRSLMSRLSSTEQRLSFGASGELGMEGTGETRAGEVLPTSWVTVGNSSSEFVSTHRPAPEAHGARFAMPTNCRSRTVSPGGYRRRCRMERRNISTQMTKLRRPHAICVTVQRSEAAAADQPSKTPARSATRTAASCQKRQNTRPLMERSFCTGRKGASSSRFAW
mmetsp:Transcript_44504/g.123185  ORF Transcript_44504/g.123185 Transcript_44504/m.123185 type:complete len:223 (-) Transcript_44504:636-1304(-)